MPMSRRHSPDPTLYAITNAEFPANTEAAGRGSSLRLREKALAVPILAAAFTPLATTIATGHAGWTAVLLPAAVVAAVGAVVGKAHAEATGPPCEPERAVEVSWADYQGDVVRYEKEAA
jgi:hypothetical protein